MGHVCANLNLTTIFATFISFSLFFMVFHHLVCFPNRNLIFVFVFAVLEIELGLTSTLSLSHTSSLLNWFPSRQNFDLAHICLSYICFISFSFIIENLQLIYKTSDSPTSFGFYMCYFITYCFWYFFCYDLTYRYF